MNSGPENIQNPEVLYRDGTTPIEMIREDFTPERSAIETRCEITRYLGENDPTSRPMMEKGLAMVDEHAEGLKTPLQRVGADVSVAPPGPRGPSSRRPARS